MLPSRFDKSLSPYDDDWDDIPSPTSGPCGKWFGGVILPLLLFAHGVACFITRHAVLLGHHNSMEVHGSRAVALGIVSVSLGLFLHCHYYWGNLYHLAALAVLGKIAALLGFIAGLGYLIVEVGIWGRA